MLVAVDEVPVVLDVALVKVVVVPVFDEVVVSVALLVIVDAVAEVVVWVVELEVVTVTVVTLSVVSVTVDGRLHVTPLQVPSSHIKAPPYFTCPA